MTAPKISAEISELALDIMEEGDHDGVGICIACGEESDGFVEPDAENYPCEACGERKVFGVEQIILLTVA